MKKMKSIALDMLLRIVAVNPMERLKTMLFLARKLDRGKLNAPQLNIIGNALLDRENVWCRFTEALFRDVDTRCLQKVTEGLLVNGSLDGNATRRAAEKEMDCDVPWAILMDPTSACNLSCTGCWAAQYGDRHSLSYEALDSICRQGKELGVYFYLFSGGEPLVRKKDVLRLCGRHQDCYFLAFTNGTLVDDDFCENLRRVANLALAFSIEGDEAATDMRRGAGTYAKVVEAMGRMQRHRLLYGYSTCYHRYNTESVGSDEFVDRMVSLGCRFAWNFTYMPVGRDACADLMATPDQRAYMYRRVREIRRTKPIFALDFWNDGEYTRGCVAGGRRYLHINAAGDVEPCAFIHYSSANIHDVTLREALAQPLFKAYRKNQPFNENHLRPCPLLDNPDALMRMVKETGAVSTEMAAPEDVETLCARTAPEAKVWAGVAAALWEKRISHKEDKEYTAR